MYTKMRFNLKFLFSIIFAVTFLVGGLFINTSKVLADDTSADLTNIAFCTMPGNYTFAAGTYTYNDATFPYALSGCSINVTGAGVITMSLDGGASATLVSGNPLYPANMIYFTAGVEKIITITTTETGKLAKTYTIKVTRGLPPPAPVVTTTAQTINIDTIHIIGTATANSTVAITGGAASATGTATAGGNFDIVVTLTHNAVNTLSVVEKDSYSNPGAATTVVIKHDNIAPTAAVVYSTTAPTKNNVTVTITPNEQVTITSEGGSLTHEFSSNGSFTFTFTDIAGNTGSTTTTVTNINKVSPVITIGDYSTAPRNTDLIITATTDKGTLNSVNHTFTANGSFAFVATDDAGNVTTQTVTITNIDKVAPVITLTGTTPLTITQGSSYTDAGATATDNVDATVTVNSTGTVNTNTVGSYTITYSATDLVGNTATEVTRIVNVYSQSSGGGSGSYIKPVISAITANIKTPDECSTGSKFNTTTGKNCNTVTPVVVGKVLGVEKFNFTKIMKNGSNGNEVAEFQKFLNGAGFDCGKIDGKFGVKTKAALIKFQIANKLTGDGVVGAKTRVLLNK